MRTELYSSLIKENGGWIDIRLRDGRKIYLVKVDLLEDTMVLTDRIRPILLSELRVYGNPR